MLGERQIVLLAVVGFSVFEGEEEVIVDGLRGCQRLEAADGLFRRFGSEGGNSMERVVQLGSRTSAKGSINEARGKKGQSERGNRNVKGGHQWWDGPPSS